VQRFDLFRLGALVAIFAVPACSGGGASAPATPNLDSGSSVRQRIAPSSLIGNGGTTLKTITASPTPSPSATAASVRAESLIGNGRTALKTITASPTPSPSATAASVRAESLIGNGGHAFLTPAATPSP
jgi:hypothetical protein